MIEVIWTIYGLVWMCAPAPVAVKGHTKAKPPKIREGFPWLWVVPQL